MSSGGFGRRTVLAAATGAVVGMVLAGCSPAPPPTPTAAGATTAAASPSTAANGAGVAVAAALSHWPRPAAEQLGAMIAGKANSGAYAVFDADNTTYRYDLEESLLPFLEMKGVLTRATMNPALAIIPFKDDGGHQESLYSYYNRLCEIDDQVCYPWVAQIFSGMTLKELKGHVDELMAYGKPIPAEYFADGALTATEVQPPKPYPGMQELYSALQANGIEVYVVSAASEELVRMVLADPRYGYGVKPQNVIGVTMLLKDRASGELTTARKQIAEGDYNPDALGDRELTPILWAPLTWYEGKPAAIKTYIDQWREPVLVGGDTPASDGPMLFQDADVAGGGLRVWVNRKDSYFTDIQKMQQDNAAKQKDLGQLVTADRGWVVVKPEEIGG